MKQNMAVLTFLKGAVRKYNDASLILRILIGIIIGAILAFIAPGWTWLETLGSLFVGARRPSPPYWSLCWWQAHWPRAAVSWTAASAA